MIHAPAVGQRVDASTGSSAFHAVLADSLLTQLKMRQMGDCQVAWLSSVAAPPHEVAVCVHAYVCVRV